NTYDEVNATGDFTGLDIGTYVITVTNTATSCMVETTHEVADPNTFELKLKPTHVSCYNGNDGSIAIELIDSTDEYSGGFQYSISGVSLIDGNPRMTVTGTTATLTDVYANLQEGAYTIEVTLDDYPHCTITKDFTIHQPDKLGI